MAKHKHNFIVYLDEDYKEFATVSIDRKLTDSEHKELKVILSTFPNTSDKWFERFKNFDPTNHNKELLKIAANAFTLIN